LNKHISALAAKVGLLSGVVLYLISQFVLKPYVFGADHYPHFLHVMAILFILNIALMWLISKFAPTTTPFEIQYTKQVAIRPYKKAKLASLMVLFILTFIYIYFA
jgi:SSS family solute:Na+ symporter